MSSNTIVFGIDSVALSSFLANKLEKEGELLLSKVESNKNRFQ